MRPMPLLAVLLLLAPPAWGVVQVSDLYEAQVPVADQGEQERVRALGAALGEVAVRVSGSREAADVPAIREGAEAAARLVQRYRYLREADALVLHARFDPGGVDALLRDVGLPRWGSERPVTLVWLAYRDGQARTIASADEPGPAAALLRELADRRALPMVLPLLDLEEQTQVRFTDIWGGFHDTVLAASRRYGTEAVLIARVERLGADHWQSRWTLVLPDGEHQWQAAGEALRAPVAGAVDELAQVLSQRFAVRGDGQGAEVVRVRVGGVHSLEDYARVARALESREGVIAVRLRQVEADAVHYDLRVQGDLASVRRQLALSDQLAPARDGPPADRSFTAVESATTGELHFRLLP